MRFVWSLLMAVLAATVALKPAAAQDVGPQPSAQWFEPGIAERFLAPQTSERNAWRGLVWPPMSGGAIGRFALSGGDAVSGLDGRPLIVGRFGTDSPFAQLANGGFGRDWPSAVKLKTGAFGFDVTPHAGLGAAGGADSRSAGAVIRFGRGLGDTNAGRPSRWYFFASNDQENLGLGFMRNEEAWRRVGLAPDPGATIGDTRAGLAWRDGPVEASFGYLYREIKPHDMDLIDIQANKESLVAFRLTLHPGAR